MMNRILEINTANRYAIVEPGVVVAEFQKAVEKANLFYPPDPGGAAVASMGGTVAMNAGGMQGVKYGVTRDYLLGLETVLPSGEVLATGALTTKDVTGYDLTRLICGSEGTLVASGCPGCRMQIYGSLGDARIQVLHPLEIIAKAGASDPALQCGGAE